MKLVLVVVLSVFFAATHILLSHGGIREMQVKKFGLMGFRAIYSIISLVTLVGAGYMLVTADEASMGSVLWALPGWAAYPAAYILMFAAIVLIVFAAAQPSPTGMAPAKLEPLGMTRITRHPMNMGFACLGVAHLLTNGSVGPVFFFGSLFVVGFIGAYHQDARKAREKGEAFAEYARKTSVFPFAAVVRGKTRLDPTEISVSLLVVASLIYFAMIFWGHEFLFGRTPY